MASCRTCRRSISRLTRRAHPRVAASRARSVTCASSARRCATSRCRTPTLAIPVYYIVAPAEASSNLARFDGVRYGLRVAGDRPARHVRGDALRRASAPRSRVASCSAPTCSPPATTTRTTRKRRKCARSSRDDFRKRVRERRRRAVHADDADAPRFRSARSPIRTRCT